MGHLGRYSIAHVLSITSALICAITAIGLSRSRSHLYYKACQK